MEGTVKWFDAKRGYGFIKRSDNHRDVFVHYTAILHEGYRELAENQFVEFEVVESGKGQQAKNVRVIG